MSLNPEDLANGTRVLDPIPFTADEQQIETNERIFQFYALFGCDPERTAVAAEVPLEHVLKLAEDGQWNKQFATLIRLKSTGRPGDLERATNRAINFVQAHRYRLFLERVLRHFALVPRDQLEDMCVELRVDAKGNESRKVNCRPFADLAAALEKCHAMTYLALVDTASDRQRNNAEAPQSQENVDVHVQLAGALQRAREGKAKPPVDITPEMS